MSVASAKLGDSWKVMQTGVISNIYYTKISQDNFTTYTYGSNSNLLLQEYVNSLGFVFAVRWSGVYLPSLDKILSEKYIMTLNEAGTGYLTKAGSINKGGFIFKSTGKMRSFNGYAIDTLLMPAGFDLGSLQ